MAYQCQNVSYVIYYTLLNTSKFLYHLEQWFSPRGDIDPNQCLETFVFVTAEGWEGPECCKHPTLPWKLHSEEYLPQMLSDWG